jgi:hypothetical protein
MRGAGHLAHLKFRQALRGEADHVTQEVRIETLPQHLPKGNLVVGHRGQSKVRGCKSRQPNPYQRSPRWAPGRSAPLTQGLCYARRALDLRHHHPPGALPVAREENGIGMMSEGFASFYGVIRSVPSVSLSELHVSGNNQLSQWSGRCSG